MFISIAGKMNYIRQKWWLLLLILATIVFCLIEAEGKGDFFIFLSAASDLSRQVDIYEARYVDGYHYYYSVLFALILKPFVYLPFFWVKFCWLLLNAGLFFHMFFLLFKSSLLKAFTDKKKWVFLLIVFLLSLRFFRDNIHTSQTTILILWCCVFGLLQIVSGKQLYGAAIMALGINIKLLPIVFIPYLIYRGYFKAAVYTILIYGGLMVLPVLFLGVDYNTLLLKTWFGLINPTNQIHVLDVDERSFHGLSTLLSTLLVKDVPDIYALQIPRNIANVSIQTLSLVLNLTRLALVFLTLFFLGKSTFKSAKNTWSQCLEISYILLLIPLIFPHQQHYSFLFAVPAAACCCYFLMELNQHKQKIYAGLLILIALLFNLKLLLGEFNAYYDHFKILTYGALLLIPMLVYAQRKSAKIIPA